MAKDSISRRLKPPGHSRAQARAPKKEQRQVRRQTRKQAWDEVCTRCGLCCYQKEYRRSKIVINLNRPCPYLDTQSKLCMVYENRFKVCKDCRKVTRYHALFSSLLPASCGYVQKYRKLKFLIRTPGFHGSGKRHS